MFEHETVLKIEAIDALVSDEAGTYVDCTFGRGGHSSELLLRLNESGKLLAFDRDEEAELAAAAVNDPRFEFVRSPFSELEGVISAKGLAGKIDGILMDLGVSSPQLDKAERGFSFRFDAPLDMRMDTSTGQTAAEWLAIASEDDITYVLKTYGEERFARRIAREIVARSETDPLQTTSDLVDICERCIPQREKKKHPATRTFQAVRIYINQELQEIETALDSALKVLKPGGRLVVISFHSLEDRIVKHFIRKHTSQPKIPKYIPIQQVDIETPLTAIGKAQFASSSEVDQNPRARSAVMRVAVRTEATL